MLTRKRILGLILVIFLLSSFKKNVYAATFNTGVTYPTTVSGHVTVGDLNGDGKKDLVKVDSFGGNGIYVRLNNGDGTFGVGISYPGGGSDPFSVSVADFNGDEKNDVVTGDQDSSTISVFTNLGEGTFGVGVTYPTGGGLTKYVDTGDLDGDGKIDIVSVEENTRKITVFINSGNGTFGVGVTYPTLGLSPESVVVEDIDGDGHMDIVTADQTSDIITVFINSGDGTFGSGVTYPTIGSGPYMAEVADISGDGKMDIITGDYDGNVITVFINTGDGTFGVGVTYPNVDEGAYAVAASDVNGDGKLEVIVSNYDSDNGSITVFPNEGDGVLGTGETYPTMGLQAASLLVTDLSGDGKPEVLTGNYINASVLNNISPPGAPTGLIGTAENEQVLLLWTAPTFGTGVTDYRVEFQSVGESWAVFDDGVSVGTSATVTNLTNGVSYDFRVSAIDVIGIGITSTSIAVTPNVPTISPTPTPTPVPNSSPQSSSSNNSSSVPVCNDLVPITNPDLFELRSEKGKVTLFYTPVSSANGYMIFYGFKKGDERFGAVSHDISNNNQGVQKVTINALDPKKTYYFKVSAINGCVNGPYSDWIPIQANTKKTVFKYIMVTKNKIKVLLNRFK